MRRRSRAWCVLKWISASACGLIAATWVFTVAGGTLALGNVSVVNEPKIKIAEGKLWYNLGEAWLVGVRPPQAKYLGYVEISLLVMLVVIAIPTALFWLADRKRPLPGQRRKCGYDLTGNLSGHCPECGEAV